MTPQQISKLFCDADTTMAGLLAVFEAGRAQARAEMRAEMVPVAKVVSTVDADGDASLRAAWLGTPPERGALLAVIPTKD